MLQFQSFTRRLPTPTDKSFKDGIVPNHLEDSEFLKYIRMWRAYTVLGCLAYMKRVFICLHAILVLKLTMELINENQDTSLTDLAHFNGTLGPRAHRLLPDIYPTALNTQLCDNQ